MRGARLSQCAEEGEMSDERLPIPALIAVWAGIVAVCVGIWALTFWSCLALWRWLM